MDQSSRALIAGREQGRTWRKVAATKTYDAWLIGWEPGSGLPEHDHGSSFRVFCVLQGSLVERGNHDPRVLTGGDRATVEPWSRHEVWNAENEPAVSLHVYSPPLGDG